MDHKIRDIRKKLGLTQTEVAERCNKTTSAFQKIEGGRSELTVAWMRAIAAALDCYPSDLLAAVDVRPARLDEGLLVEVVETCLQWIDEHCQWLDEQGLNISRAALARAVAHIYTDIKYEMPDAADRAQTLDQEAASILSFAAKAAA